MTTRVDADWLRSWVAACVDGLAAARTRIDALNVFPVPDGDTGTNLYLTLGSAWEQLAAALESGPTAGTGLSGVAGAVSRGALVGARGNSGVIAAQMVHGCTAALAAAGDRPAWTPALLAAMLRRACDEGYRAVAQPVEGTILTVARAAAEAAERLADGAREDSGRVLDAAAEIVAAARSALDRTPDQLPALRQAGVVDAGGAGLVVILEALAASLAGIAPASPSVDHGTVAPVHLPVEGEDPGGLPGYCGPAFEVMYLLEATAEAVDSLREALASLGDSLVVVGEGALWNVHVHVDDAGAAVEAALAVGRPSRIRITYLGEAGADQHQGRTRGLVAVAHGPGTAALLADAGAEVVSGRPHGRPSTGEFLQAIEACDAAEVIVLPGDSDARATADLAAAQAREQGLRVAVVPSRSIVQTLAAVAVHDPQSAFDADVAVMSAAAGSTRYAAVTVATKAALTSAGPCDPGDVLGIVDGDIVHIGPSPEGVTRSLIDRMLASGGDLVTLVFGVDASRDARAELPVWVRRTHPLVDVVVHEGGQPLWPVILGVE